MNESINIEPAKEICEELRKEISCDFVGLAFQNRVRPDINWFYATGNINDKYKLISVRYGKGIAGKVIMTSRPMFIEHFPYTLYGKAIEYPIMLAEKLISAYAEPVLHNGVPKGALLIGEREIRVFLEEEKKIVQQYARKLEIDFKNIELF